MVVTERLGGCSGGEFGGYGTEKTSAVVTLNPEAEGIML